jgi:hypothetical protein
MTSPHNQIAIRADFERGFNQYVPTAEAKPIKIKGAQMSSPLLLFHIPWPTKVAKGK